MDPSIIGAGIGAASKILGGIFGGITGNKSQEREYNRQKEFAQNAIQWKVADAKKAGLHPLYALGASTAQYSPQATLGTDYGLSEMGQGIQDFARNYQNPREKEHARWVSRTNELLDMRYKQLQNDLLESQIEASKTAINKQPGNPISLGGKSADPVKYTTPKNLSPTRGPINTGENLFEFGQSEKPGVWRLLPTNDYAQKFEDKIILEYAPFADAWRAGGFQGKSLQGMIYSSLHHGWIRADSDLALDLRDFLKEKEFNRKRKSQEILERH